VLHHGDGTFEYAEDADAIAAGERDHPVEPREVVDVAVRRRRDDSLQLDVESHDAGA
jgi:hypothetical protein